MNNPIKIKVKIFENWHDLSPIYNDFKIKKVRDKSQIFVVRTISTGTMIFTCSDYELLLPFVSKKIEGILTETICGESYEYNCDLVLSNSYNFATKKITANVIIKDKYWCLENNIYNGFSFQTKTNITTYKEYTQIIEENTKVTGGRATELTQLMQALSIRIPYTVGNRIVILGTDTYNRRSFPFIDDFNLHTLLLTSIKNLYKYNTTKEYPAITLSLFDLFDIIRIKFFAGYYLIPAQNVVADWEMRFDWFGKTSLFNNAIDLTSYEDKNNILIAFKNDNNSGVLQYKTFEFQDDKDVVASEPFATTEVEFKEKNNANVQTLNTVNSDIFQVNKNIELHTILQVEKNTNIIDFSIFNSQYYNIEPYKYWDYADGDFSELILKNDTAKEAKIYFGKMFITASVHFEFNCNVNSSDLYLAMAHGSALIQHAISQGHNSFSLNYVHNSPYDYTPYIYTSGSIFSDLRITNMQVTFSPEHYEQINNSQALTTENLVSNHGAEMPADVAIINGNDYNVLQSNTFQQEILYNFERPMHFWGEFDKVKTSLGWLRVDEISRTYSNNNYSLTELTLTGK